MIKRMSALILAMVLLFSLSSTVFACDEKQTNTYVTQIIFGDNALSKENDENVKMLMSALYLCSEQADNQGQDKINFLKGKKVSGIPALSDLNIKGSSLLECSHNSWEYVFAAAQKNQANRKKVLQNTVNKVFDFGFVNNLTGSKRGKCNSFAALLYYSHLLSDYLADDPAETEVSVNGKLTPAYAGTPSIELNGNKPSFTSDQKKNTQSFIQYSPLDGQGRAGVALGCLGPDTIGSAGPRDTNAAVRIRPSGWVEKKEEYKDIINSSPPYVYRKCHLIAHMFGGLELETNLITGTYYLNNTAMSDYETKVQKYINSTGNHVLYRVTPIYRGDNKVATGVQMEAYSVEDTGALSFNVFCYNVQPGVRINYSNGDNELSDLTVGAEGILPFATNNASDNNPDLIYEMNKHLAILFEDQKSSATYTTMMNDITSIAVDARAISNQGNNDEDGNKAKNYVSMKNLEYKYLEVLKSYVPKLLEKEDFFASAFK